MNDTILTLTAQIASAYMSKNTTHVAEIPDVIGHIGTALLNLHNDSVPRITMDAPNFPILPATPAADQWRPAKSSKPAIDPEKSLFPGHILCISCGKKCTMLKRHIRTAHDMTPDDYRDKWSLPASYPMLAPEYAAIRSGIAKSGGLGKRSIPGKISRKNGGRRE